MSFGGSPADILIVIEFAASLYKKCKAAGGEYLEVAREVRSLHTVLRHLKYEVEAPDSLLNRDNSKYRGQLTPIIGDCDYTLQKLDELLRKYRKLADDKPAIWDRIRFASSEMDSNLGELRIKLINHKTTITVFLDMVQLQHSARVSKTLEGHGGQLDILLDKVDRIAERMGQRANSMLTSYGSDDKEVWKEFRRELVAEGFSSDVLQRNKDVLRAYIREIDQKGLLTEAPPTPISVSGSVSADWLESVAAVQPETRNIRSNEGMKELVVHEENMKFPQSMKGERARPDSQDTSRDIQHGLSAMGIETKEPSKADLGEDNSNRDESDTSSKQSQILIVRTRDLSNLNSFSTAENSFLKAPQSQRPPRLQIESQPSFNSRSSSPASINSQVSNRSIRHSVPSEEQQTTELSKPRGRSSHSGGGSSEPVAIPTERKRIDDEHSRSPRPNSVPLAPDSQGNKIPLDAKWTKIRRSLVSLEILDQDGHRYEARPEFVAVLGVLTHQKIEELAFRSKAVREARRQRSRETPSQPSPRKAPQNFRYTRSQKGGYNTPSDEDSDSSPEPEEQHRPRHKERRKRTSHNLVSKDHSYPNSPSTPEWSPNPMWSPNSRSPGWHSPPHIQGNPYFYVSPNTSHGTATSPQPNLQPAFNYYPPPQPYLSPNLPAENRNHRSRRHGDSDRRHSNGKDAKRETTRNSRWRDNLTAAGIGGAAGSLLSVLSEAAGEF